MKFKIGTRGSKLALWQANTVKNLLEEKYPEHEYELVIIQTKGDKIQDKALDKIGDKGLFIKEIENQLLTNDIDLAIHSLKDVPSEIADEFVMAKTIMREDNRDVLISKNNLKLADLPSNARVATGSKRRAFQLKKLRDDLEIIPIRGNLDTRLKKLFDDKNNIDAIVMASAGIKRLGFDNLITEYFDIDEIVPACGQGAIGIELRKDDHDLLEMINALSDENLDQKVQSERLYMKLMNGTCHTPIGASVSLKDGQYEMIAVYGDDEKLWKVKAINRDPKKLAEEVSEKMQKQMEVSNE